jgi:hypothetical protein
MRLQLWPRIPTTATEMNQAARDVARARDRRPARASTSESKPPTIEQAAPARKQDRGPWASGGSAGGSSTASGTHRIFALALVALLPLTRPRAFRVAPGSSLVPTGELGLSLPERPG